MDTSAKRALAQRGLQPRKRLGQNFLTNPQLLEKLVRAAGLQPGETALEIGPGLGHLTRLLAAAASRVVAVEVDEALAGQLAATLSAEGIGNVQIVREDFLRADLYALVEGAPYRVVANLPYYVTSAILRRLLEIRPAPQRIVVLVQREVAQRLTARPPHLSLLAVSAQWYAEVKLGEVIPAGAFYPRPKVDSAWVVLEPRARPPGDGPEPAQLWQVVRAGFAAPRQQLRNTLARGLDLAPTQAEHLLARAGVAPNRRAATVTLEEWAALARAFESLRERWEDRQ